VNTRDSGFGKTNPVVTQLRGAALREVRVIDGSEKSKGKPIFDSDHKHTPPNNAPAEDFDSSNGVAQYPGQNVEHIGNGSGGVRR
jgi:hypothetical protein